jgi:dGTP triphosphohydrolase
MQYKTMNSKESLTMKKRPIVRPPSLGGIIPGFGSSIGGINFTRPPTDSGTSMGVLTGKINELTQLTSSLNESISSLKENNTQLEEEKQYLVRTINKLEDDKKNILQELGDSQKRLLAEIQILKSEIIELEFDNNRSSKLNGDTAEQVEDATDAVVGAISELTDANASIQDLKREVTQLKRELYTNKKTANKKSKNTSMALIAIVVLFLIIIAFMVMKMKK